MIYLIDEKIKRQASYGWSVSRFEKYKEVIEPINNYSRFEDEKSLDDIFTEGNVILFHESFFNGIAGSKRDIAQSFMQRLKVFGEKEIVVYYGGSKSSRKVDGNSVYLPVSVLYEHLETYLNRSSKDHNEIVYLIWGENPEIEKDLLERIIDANNAMVDDNCNYSAVSSNILLIIASDKNQLYIPDTNPNISTVS